jgi:hypothetical protein
MNLYSSIADDDDYYANILFGTASRICDKRQSK